MPEVPVSDGVAEVPPPPPPDTLALRMERNEELSNVNSFPNIPRPPHERNRKPVEISDPPRVERRPRRDHDPRNDVSIGVHLRPQEIKALSEVGRFRVVAVRDLAETVYGGDRSALERDLGYLEKKGIVTLRSVNARRDGSWRQPERIQVVTLTRPGKKTVRQVGTLRHDQQLYAGLVKPREVEHDTQIYRPRRSKSSMFSYSHLNSDALFSISAPAFPTVSAEPRSRRTAGSRVTRPSRPCCSPSTMCSTTPINISSGRSSRSSNTFVTRCTSPWISCRVLT
jgi:DNA-binding transcriptional ArsR family regulator